MQVAAVEHEAERRLHGIGKLIGKLWRDISIRDVRTGRWFMKLLTEYVAYWEAHHGDKHRPQLMAAEREAEAASIIARAARAAAFAGAGSAGLVTGASLATAETNGFAGPLVLPIAAAGMVSEMVGRSVIHLNMACELADLYGVRFPAGREGELVRIYALAVGAEMHETETDPGRGLVERVVRLQETGELGKMVASRMVGETLLRNVVPFADVVISSIGNWKLTHQVGAYVQGYVRRRLDIDAAVDQLNALNPKAVDLALEGMWFIFIADGRLTGIETALLAHLLRRQDARDVTSRFVTDEADWVDRVKQLPADPETRAAFVQALTVVATADGTPTGHESAILRSVARTLGVPVPVAADQVHVA